MKRIEARGLCECGCGQRAGPYARTELSRGMVRGQPRRFIEGHNSRVSGYGRNFDLLRIRSERKRRA